MMLFSRRGMLALTAAAGAFPSAAMRRHQLEVPFVPTPHSLVEKMLDLAALSPPDYLIDLGCGDGRIAVAAARRGARALGVDLDPLRIREAAAAARIAGVEARTRFRRQDLFETPIFDASVVALYLLPELNLRLRPRLLTELDPGARVISHAFSMGDWQPEREEVHDGRRIFLWIVPAAVAGSWSLSFGDGRMAQLDLEQRFQTLSGTLSGGDGTRPIGAGRLTGAEFQFDVDGDVLRGRVEGADLVGDGWRGRRIGG
jgi:SAM-dependent methyltransferase